MPTPGQITIAIDRQNRVLATYGISVSKIPDLSQCDTIALLLQIVDPPTQSIGGQFTLVTDINTQAGKPRVTIAKAATSTLANQPANVLAYTYEAGWTWDGTQGGFTGTLNLNTVEMQAFLAGAENGTVEFEVRFSSNGVLNTLLPGPENSVKIVANDDAGTSPPISILNGVQLLFAPLQIKFPSGNIYAVSETGDGHLSFDLIPP